MPSLTVDFDAFRFHISREDIGIIPGVEQNALAGNFDESREAPILVIPGSVPNAS